MLVEIVMLVLNMVMNGYKLNNVVNMEIELESGDIYDTKKPPYLQNLMNEDIIELLELFKDLKQYVFTDYIDINKLKVDNNLGKCDVEHPFNKLKEVSK